MTGTNALRSEGWRVNESFTPKGPTDPVTLLLNEHSLTQLAGVDPVAWQIPWSVMGDVRLLRSPGRTSLSATIDGRTFEWRTSAHRRFDELTPFVLLAGGRVERTRGALTGLTAALVVALLSSAGYLGTRWESRHRQASAESALQALNLRLSDLPGSWSVSTDPLLANLVGPANQVFKTNYTTTTTAPAANSVYEVAVRAFQHCMGISNAADRMYGAAGQLPLYQVASSVFSSSRAGGLEVASYVQYYPQLSMVQRDTAEMRSPRFSSCFANVSADLVEASSSSNPRVSDGKALSVLTFAKGFHRVGVATVALTSSTSLASVSAHLFVVVATQGHYETTFFILSSSWPTARSLVTSLTNVMVSHIAPSSGVAA